MTTPPCLTHPIFIIFCCFVLLNLSIFGWNMTCTLVQRFLQLPSAKGCAIFALFQSLKNTCTKAMNTNLYQTTIWRETCRKMFHRSHLYPKFSNDIPTKQFEKESVHKHFRRTNLHKRPDKKSLPICQKPSLPENCEEQNSKRTLKNSAKKIQNRNICETNLWKQTSIKKPTWRSYESKPPTRAPNHKLNHSLIIWSIQIRCWKGEVSYWKCGCHVSFQWCRYLKSSRLHHGLKA